MRSPRASRITMPTMAGMTQGGGKTLTSVLGLLFLFPIKRQINLYPGVLAHQSVRQPTADCTTLSLDPATCLYWSSSSLMYARASASIQRPPICQAALCATKRQPRNASRPRPSARNQQHAEMILAHAMQMLATYRRQTRATSCQRQRQNALHLV